MSAEVDVVTAVADALHEHLEHVTVALPLVQALREMCEHASLRHSVVGADAIETLSRLHARHDDGATDENINAEMRALCNEALALLLPPSADGLPSA